MADVFLSYARPNLEQAMRVAARLRDSNRSVWFDESLPAHRAYSDVIEEQLESARAVVVLWSEPAARSQWVRSEANRARESGRLVQLRLDDARLPMPFDQIQCADLRGWKGDSSHGWTVVAASIDALLGNRSPPPKTRHQPPSRERRRLLVGASAVAALTAGGLFAWRGAENNDAAASPEAQLLLQKGMDALQQVDALDTDQPVSAAQAIALLTQATEADPGSATAWGGLAMALAVSRPAAPLADRGGIAERSRSAAARALALDADEFRALAALRMLEQVYRNWLQAERARRKTLGPRSTLPIHTFLLSDVLGSVGRWREAADLSMRADRTRFLIPGADRKVVINLWCAGRLQEADKAVDEMVGRWPDHPQVWRTRLAYHMYSGRPSEALTLLDSSDRPAAIPDALVAVARATGLALTGKADLAQAVGANLAYRPRWYCSMAIISVRANGPLSFRPAATRTGKPRRYSSHRCEPCGPTPASPPSSPALVSRIIGGSHAPFPTSV